MNQGMMLIMESEKELQEMMRKESNVHKRARIHMLYLFSSKQARNRKEVARILGVYRETVGDWLRKYEQGGIEELLEIEARGGSQSSLPQEVIAGMREQLSQPTGFQSYHELLAWVNKTFSLTTNYDVVYYTATKILNARLAVARKSHIKKKPARKKPSKPALKPVSAMPR